MDLVNPQSSAKPLRKVLLIEDDRGQARIVQASFAKFAREHFELFWAATYEDGLTALKQNAFDACLLDYQLGPRSGLDLLREIKTLGIDTPVIVVTSESSPEVDDLAMELGALDYLVKFELSPRSLERSLRYTMKQHAMMRELRRLITRDPGTGLLSHAEGLAQLETEVEKARKFSRALSILLVSIDRLAEINAAHGTAAGDAAVLALAAIIRETVDEAGVAIRWESDAFAVWLPHTDAVSASRVAERVCAQAAKANFTVSAGVAEWRNTLANGAELVAAAARALGEARAAGGNRVG